MKKQHGEAREALRIDIDRYLKARIKDSNRADSLARHIGCALDIYAKIHNVRDLSARFRIYRRWSDSCVTAKLALDSANRFAYDEYKSATSANTDSVAAGYVDRLAKLVGQYEALDDSFAVAGTYLSVARVHQGRNLNNTTHAYLDSAETWYRALDSPDGLAQCNLLRSAVFGAQQAEYIKAFDALDAVITQANRVESNGLLVYALLHQAYHRIELGQWETSMQLAGEALSRSEESGMSVNAAQAANYLAECYLDLKHLDSAEQYARRAAEIRESLLDDAESLGQQLRARRDLAYAMSTLATVYQVRHRTDKARRQFLAAQDHFVRCQDSVGWCHNRIRYGWYLVADGQIRAAIRLFDETLPAIRRPEAHLECLHGLAMANYLGGDTATAKAKAEECVGLLERTRQLLTIDLRLGLLRDRVGFYDLLSDVHFSAYEKTGIEAYIDSALQYAEMRRGRSLVEQLTSDSSGNAADASTSHKPVSIDSSGQSLISLSQQRLKDTGGVLLSYHMTSFSSWLVTISTEDVRLHRLKMSSGSISVLIHSFAELINHRPISADTFDSISLVGASLRHAVLPEPVLHEMSAERIVIVPSGMLHGLAMSALPCDDRRFLVETNELVFTPSLNVFARASQYSKRTERVPTVIALANEARGNQHGFPELHYAEAALDSIARALGKDHVVAFLGNEATESRLREIDLTPNHCLHIEAHGYCDMTDPSRSALLLSPSDAALGASELLHASEIAQMQLPVRLAFLSACQSGAGPLYEGEGPMTLARSFLQAGCGSVIVSRWNVDDLSASLMAGQFYRGIARGESVGNALRQAQCAMIRSDRPLYGHPYYWAGFAVYGSGL